MLRLWKVFNVVHKNSDGSHKLSVLIQQGGIKYFDNTSLLRTEDTSFTFQVQ